MLNAKSDNCSNWVRIAKTAFRIAIEKPFLVRRCAGVAAALVGLTLMTVAWDDPAHPVSHPQAAVQNQTNWEPDFLSQHAIRTFQRFAFNALVLPLIDDTEPPRWSRHAIDWICDGRGEVTVNGQPLVDGLFVPATSTVRWKLERCAPLAGAELLIDGEISFDVSRNDMGLRADAVNHTLTADTLTGSIYRMPAIDVEHGEEGSSAEETP